jgi:glycosyltransferase involved in cell wall biosynthesis
MAHSARVAIVGPTYPYKGGIAQHTTELAHRLGRRGVAVEIVSWSAQYPQRLYPGQQHVQVPEQEPFGNTSYPLSWRRPDGWVRTGRRLRRRVDAVVLVIVTPFHAPAYLGLLAGLGRQTRVVTLCHNVLPHERRRGDVPLTRALLRRADAVLVHVQAEAERARLLTSAPVTIAGMPPSLWSDIRPVPRHPHPDGLTAPRRRLLFFGIVRPYKGLDLLLRALSEAPDVSLTVAGEFWDSEPATRALAAELGISDRVQLRPGYVAAHEVPALFAAADALVLPYRSGTATQNAQVAHLYGLPVVGTRVGTLPDHIRDGVNGLLVPPDDPAALAAALRRLYEPGVLPRLRANVKSPDIDGEWEGYLAALTNLLSTPAGCAM